MAIGSSLRATLNENAPRYYHEQDDQDAVEEIIATIGLDTYGGDALGTGGGRAVFDMHALGYPSLALKLALPHPNWDGLQQNAHEVSLWTTLSAEKKQYLVPVLDHGPEKYWLLMPKGSSVSTVPYDWLQDAKYHLRGHVWRKDISEENIVSVNGTVGLCDYGTPPQ